MKLLTHKPVAFQGEQGAFSEIAVLNIFESSVAPEPTVSFREVFEKVSKGVCEYGVVPVENSLGGLVYQVWDCFNDSDLVIVAETELKIEQCLIVNPETSFGDIKKIYSHYQPVLQCANFLQKHVGWSIVDTYDTAGSVKIIKELPLDERKNTAAIASERAALVYGMTVLEKNIQDSDQNFTRFVVITKKKQELGNKGYIPPGSRLDQGSGLTPLGITPFVSTSQLGSKREYSFTSLEASRNKFTAVISLENKIGSLLEVLQIAVDYKINLTSVHSRPKKDVPFSYIFFIEGEHNESVTTFLTEMKTRFTDFKILGVYMKY